MATSRRIRLLSLALAWAAPCAASAQEHVGTEEAGDRNGAAKAATHAPKVRLEPLVAWEFVRRSNAAHVAERRAKQADRSADAKPPKPPKPTEREALPDRPAGAGRYVCAVLACADLDAALAPAMGLGREDVLVLRAPGPFVSPDDVAMLERAVTKHHVPLILFVGHERCDTIRVAPAAPDALTRRVRALRQRSRRGQPLHLALLEQQRALLLASSSVLRDASKRDALRILPTLFEPASGALTSTAARAWTMPIRPVK